MGLVVIQNMERVAYGLLLTALIPIHLAISVHRSGHLMTVMTRINMTQSATGLQWEESQRMYWKKILPCVSRTHPLVVRHPRSLLHTSFVF